MTGSRKLIRAPRGRRPRSAAAAGRAASTPVIRARAAATARAGEVARSAASPRRRWVARSRSQSPSVERTRWSAPARRSAAATSSRSSAAALAKRRRTLRRLVLTWSWRPVSGSISQRSPIGVSSMLARVADLDRQHAVAGAQRAHAALPVALAAEVGHQHDQPALAGDGGGRGDRGAERGRARAVLLGLPAQLGQQLEQPDAALARAQHLRRAAAERHHAEPVAAPARDVADGDRHALGDVGLAAVGGAEGHRGRGVEHQPGGQRALAHVHAHVRLAHAGGHVPVDVADVVAREVRPDHRQLGAGADLRRQVLAGHEALDPPQHGEVERAQDGGRDRPAGRSGRARGGSALARDVRRMRPRGALTAAALRAPSPPPCRTPAAPARRRRTPP